jgi:hypothetical protein
VRDFLAKVVLSFPLLKKEKPPACSFAGSPHDSEGSLSDFTEGQSLKGLSNGHFDRNSKGRVCSGCGFCNAAEP